MSLFGTTGEANSMTAAERMRGLELVLAGGVPANTLMPGTGCSSVVDTVTITKHAIQHGVTDVLVLPPFFYKHVSDDGVFDAYSYIIDRVADDRLRVFLYHIPQYSGVPLSVSLVERLLAAYPGIVVGIKDSSASRISLQQFCQLRELRVFVGAERLIHEALQLGAAGTICALGNTSGDTLAALCAERDSAQANTLQRKLSAQLDVADRYGFIAALKTLLAERQSTPEWANVRPPLQCVPPPLQRELYNDFQRAAATA